MPVLIIYGRQDQFFTMEMQQLMLDRLPQARLEIIENCGHLPSLEQAEPTTQLLLAWLNPGNANERS
jgi:pimeloyl-ACP methyl ester carboxylesterase